MNHVNPLKLGGNHAATFVMPTSQGTLLVDLDRLSLPRKLFDGRVKIGSFPQVCRAMFTMLDSLSPRNSGPSSTFKDSSVARQNHAWVLNGYQRLWKPLFRWLQVPVAATESKDRICSQFVSRVKLCYMHLSLLSTQTELASDLIHMLGRLLTLDILNQLPASQLQLGQVISDLTTYLKHTELLVICGKAAILPTLQQLQKRDFYPLLETQLQVKHSTLARICDNVTYNGRLRFMSLLRHWFACCGTTTIVSVAPNRQIRPPFPNHPVFQPNLIWLKS